MKNERLSLGLLVGAIGLLALLPVAAAQPPTAHLYSAPYKGIGAIGTQGNSTSGCTSNEIVKSIATPGFQTKTGRITLGSESSIACSGTAVKSVARSSTSVALAGPTFKASSTGSAWVNLSFRLTFGYTFNDTCKPGCSLSNYGSSSYGIWINASLYDRSTKTNHTIAWCHSCSAAGYINTSYGGATNFTTTFANASIPFWSSIALVAGHHYQFRIVLTAVAAAYTVGGHSTAYTEVDLATGSDGVWLASLSVV